MRTLASASSLHAPASRRPCPRLSTEENQPRFSRGKKTEENSINGELFEEDTGRRKSNFISALSTQFHFAADKKWPCGQVWGLKTVCWGLKTGKAKKTAKIAKNAKSLPRGLARWVNPPPPRLTGDKKPSQNGQNGVKLAHNGQNGAKNLPNGAESVKMDGETTKIAKIAKKGGRIRVHRCPSVVGLIVYRVERIGPGQHGGCPSGKRGCGSHGENRGKDEKACRADWRGGSIRLCVKLRRTRNPLK